MNRKQVVALAAGIMAGAGVWFLPWHWPPSREVSREELPDGRLAIKFERTIPPGPPLTSLAVLAATGVVVYRLRRRRNG